MKLKNPEVIELINQIQKYSHGPSESVYYRCKKPIERLGEIGHPAAVDLLISLMQKYHRFGQEERIRQSCSLALMKIGNIEGVKAVIKYGTYPVVDTWVRGLIGLEESVNQKELNLDDIQITISDELIELLIEYLKLKKPSNIKGMIVIVLGCIRNNPRVIEALRIALENDNTTSSSFGFDLIFPILGYPDYRIAELAGLFLVRLDDQESGSRIIHLALSKWWYLESKPKDKLIRFMYFLGWDSVIPTLGEIGKEFPEKVIACLVSIGDTKASELLEEYLCHPSPSVRKIAANSLGIVGASSAIEALDGLLNDKKFGVRQAAKKAIKQIHARQ
jgi:hypothetical protein